MNLLTCTGVAAWAGVWMLACSSKSVAVDAGVDAGIQIVLFDVSGQARIYPPAADYLAAQGAPSPAWAGLTVTLEEPLRAGLGDPHARLGRQTLDATGAFFFPAVPNAFVDRQLAADVREDADGGIFPHFTIAPAATVLYDDALPGGPPIAAVDGGIAEVLPLRYVVALGNALGSNSVLAATDGGTSDLLVAGYIVGRVLDADGGPVEGASLVPDDATLQSQVFYPSADLSGQNPGGTSSSGLYVFVHGGGQARPFHLGVGVHPGYPVRNAVSASNVGLVMDLAPGSQQAP